jgi:hypothetical protein
MENNEEEKIEFLDAFNDGCLGDSVYTGAIVAIILAIICH